MKSCKVRDVENTGETSFKNDIVIILLIILDTENSNT